MGIACFPLLLLLLAGRHSASQPSIRTGADDEDLYNSNSDFHLNFKDILSSLAQLSLIRAAGEETRMTLVQYSASKQHQGSRRRSTMPASTLQATVRKVSQSVPSERLNLVTSAEVSN